MKRSLLSLLLVGAAVLPARADYLYSGIWKRDLPACDQAEVLAAVNVQFSSASALAFHPMLLSSISGIQDVGDSSSPAARHCSATGNMPMGQPAAISYVITGDLGSSMGWKVETSPQR